MMRDSDRISILLVLAFKQLLQYENMPEWLVVGLKQLELPEVVNEFNLDELTKSAETSSALLIVLYYSYLYDYMMWSPVLLRTYLETFTTNHTDLKTLPVQCIKCLVLLLAWLSTSSEISYSNSCCTRRLLDILRSSSITNWYTHHPWILNWAFTDVQITECCGARILELWLPTLVEEIEHDEENNGGRESENCLLHIPTILKYRDTSTVLISLMGSEDKEISDSSKNIIHWIINKNDEYEESTIDTMTKHSTDLLHQLFRQEQYPQDHQIINVLGVLTKLLDNPKHNDTITRGVVPTLYHIIKMIGQEEDIENDITSVSLQYILTILHHKTDLGHLGVTVAPMLTQSTEFMSKLEECVKCKLWKIKNKSLHIITWLAMSPQHINVTSVIRIKTSYIIELISTCPTWCIIPTLRLLTIALSIPVKNTPVVFYRESCIVEEPLFTKREIRHIYMYMQQFMCQDDIEILEHCTDCLKTIFSFCKKCNNGLDKELLNHPWNQHLIDTLIEINYGHGVKDAVLDILILLQVGDNKVCLSEDILTLWLYSILDTTLTSHKSHLLQQLLAKVKKEGVDSQLLTDVKQHLLNVME
ncbi:meiosis inhibitor protein 1 [Patella vulgata]|uniref:meiosis inhibitor protein 1 n=1 Tax=Patella vulgata TaxID=6465 RepID=UPI00217F6B79|nr:meiosis inhibitor protein 1 [Patella vulgata]